MRRSSTPALEQMKFLQALAGGLRAELLEAEGVPLPERLAMLMRRLDWIAIHTQGRSANMGQAEQKRRAVMVVEDDAELRNLTVALLEDGDLDTIECESAEAALATMLLRGRDVVMIFADIRLPGVMDVHF
jgi:hypothetical protein